jgi:hypothetical protein
MNDKWLCGKNETITTIADDFDENIYSLITKVSQKFYSRHYRWRVVGYNVIKKEENH